MRERYVAWQRGILTASLLLLLPTCGNGSGGTEGGGLPAVPPDPISISLQTVATGLTSPVFLTHAGDGSGRLFVVLQTGEIRIIDANGTLLAQPFLDISANGLGLMIALDPTFDERGLLGLAFHPNFAANGRFFIRYSAPRAGVNGEPCFGTGRGCHRAIISEFNVLGDPTTNNVADPTSERVVFQIDQPQFNHNGGHIAFGPDGFLYFSLGDGGGSNDGLDVNPPPHGPTGHGQNINTLLGSICRIDIDAPFTPGLQYAIPPTNPFAQGPGAPEIYAYGLRNPYRFSFDDGAGGTNRLYCGDVGQRRLEELDIIEAGGNYGWAHREGDTCFDPFDPTVIPGSCAAVGPLGEALIDPVLTYGRDIGISIVPGYVYRGAAIPDLQGHFVFGDWSSNFGPADGSLFFCHTEGPQAFLRARLQIDPGDQDLNLTVNGIGRGEDGEIYVCGGVVSAPGGAGNILRIVPTTP